MSALIDKLFTASQSDAIRKLCEDKSSMPLIEQAIGQKLMGCDEVIDDLPLAQLMFLTSLSPFASSPNECHDIAEIIFWGIKQENIIPSIVMHRDRELAYRCLISLGLFKKTLMQKCNRHGAPSPDFYRNVGISSFRYIGKIEISNHFYKWELFLSEMFV
jgi:hypothetical protein